MPTLKITQAVVDRLTWASAVAKWYDGKPPAEDYVPCWDTQCPGFGFRLYRTERKTYRALPRVNGQPVPVTIGTTGTFPNVADARARAREILQQAAAGIDPRVQRQQQADRETARQAHEAAAAQATLGAAIDRYLTERPADRERRSMSREYLVETTRTLIKNVKNTPLGSRPLAEITADEIRRHVRAIAKATPQQANHTLVYLKAMLGWAVDEGLIDRNPAIGVKLPAQRVERERVLDDDEIKFFWLACEEVGHPFGTHAQICLLTGQRRDEVAQMTWGELNHDNTVWTLPSERTKNGRAHIVHLALLAREILEKIPRPSRWIFTTGMRGSDAPISGWAQAKARIAAAMQAKSDRQIERWTLHDLRRTCASHMAELGVAPHVIDKILNHSSGKISGIARIYNRFDYADERKLALEALARHVEALIGLERPAPEAPENVIRLAAAR
jgi:integrase